MKLLVTTPPPFDIADWAARPFAERARMAVQAFGLNGGGQPLVAYVFYAVLGTLFDTEIVFRTPKSYFAEDVLRKLAVELQEGSVHDSYAPGNTGSQALAIALRGITPGELDEERVRAVVSKEAWLGFLNGVFVGLVAALAMFVFATMQGNPLALRLAFVVLIAMITSCTVSGVAGALVPLALE